MLPDYTDHLNSRMEAAARTRQSFENKMQPTIHVQVQVRNVVADSYDAARGEAYNMLAADAMTNGLLHALLQTFLGKYGEEVADPWRYTFLKMCRVAKEVDGTYTVTLP